ncbi:MAG: peptidylprolyl isomerase [Candidatus Cloacimonadia bacterium]
MMKIYKWLIPFLVLIILLSFSNCAKDEKPEKDRIVAQVDDEYLYESELRKLFTEEEWEMLSKEKKQAVIEDWIEITLLAKEAKKRGLDKQDDVKFNILYAQKIILANELLTQELKKLTVTEDEVFSHYNLQRNSYKKPVTLYRIQQFTVPNWTVADSAITLFNQGEAFYTVARQLGEGYGARTVSREDVEPSFWNFLSGLKKWNIRIFQDEEGLKIVQLLDIILEERPIPFAEIRDSLRASILENKRTAFLENVLDTLQIQYTVKIY